jgi:shikimate kinase
VTLPGPISLVALPGGGKSTVGRHVARRLCLEFVDTDAVIEQRIGGSIREFFDREGEETFRDLEEAVIGELVATHRGVLATGGGAVLRPATRRALNTHGTCLYLRATPEELMRRLRGDTKRPLLQVANPLGKLRELYAQRDPLYRETAHFIVETGRPSVPTLVNMVMMQLEMAHIGAGVDAAAGSQADGAAPSQAATGGPVAPLEPR